MKTAGRYREKNVLVVNAAPEMQTLVIKKMNLLHGKDDIFFIHKFP
jgi:hypothetical protein